MKRETHNIKSRRRSIFIFATLLCVSSLSAFASQAALQNPPLNTAPAGEATAAIQDDKLRLSNNAIGAEWHFQENGLAANTLTAQS